MPFASLSEHSLTNLRTSAYSKGVSTPKRSVESLWGDMRGPLNVSDYVLLIIVGLVIAYGVWMIFRGA